MIIKENGKFIDRNKVNAAEVVQIRNGKYALAFYLEGGVILAGEYSEEEKANEVLEEILNQSAGIQTIYVMPVEDKDKFEEWKDTVEERRN